MSISDKLTTVAENVPKVYEAGKKAEYDEFWDTIQNFGKREVYYYTFCNIDAYSPYYQMGNWNEKKFLPKYPIAPKKCGTAVFFGLEIDNFIEHCEKNGIVIDLSQATTISNFYRGLKTKCIPDINAKSATEISSTFYDCTLLEESPDILNGELITNYNACYSGCNVMTKIPRLWATNVTNYTSAFNSCSSLSEIEQIEGEIKVDIKFKWSPLSTASLKSIITHLKPYYGTDKEFTYTLTVKASAWEALEEAGFTDEDYQWVFDNWGTPPSAYDSWETLMGGWLGWNLVLA